VNIGRADYAAWVAVSIRHVRELAAPSPGGGRNRAFGMVDGDLAALERAFSVKGCGKLQVVIGRQHRRIGTLLGHGRIEVATGVDPDRLDTPQATGDALVGEVGDQQHRLLEFRALGGTGQLAQLRP